MVSTLFAGTFEDSRPLFPNDFPSSLLPARKASGVRDEIHINMTAVPQPTGPDGAGEHEKDTLAPTAVDAGRTYLRPHDAFPLELPAVSTDELHILYSRICRQLDREYVFGPGPHPETHGRFHELSAELIARETAGTRIE